MYGLDSSQHLEQGEYDLERTAFLEAQGYKVVSQEDDIRFWNNQVENEIEGVICAIEFALDDTN